MYDWRMSVGIAEGNVLRLDVDTFAESQVCNAVIQQALSLVNAIEFLSFAAADVQAAMRLVHS